MMNIVLPRDAGLVERRNLTGFIFSAIGGLLLGLAWQDLYSFWFGLVGQSCFFVSLKLSRSLIQSLFNAVFIGILLTCVSSGGWLPDTIEFLLEVNNSLSLLLTLAVACWQSLPFLLTALLWWFVRPSENSWALLPGIWCLSDSLVPELYPIQLGHLAAEAFPLNQLAELGGVHLLTVTMAHLAVVPLSWPRRTKAGQTSSFVRPQAVTLAHFVLLFALLMCGLSWGSERFQHHERAWKRKLIGNDRFTLMVVQSETEFASSNQRMIDATRTVGDRPDLIVWPESALGNYSRQLKSFADENEVKKNSRGEGSQFRPLPNPSAPLLAGANTWSDANGVEQNFVSALLLDQSEILVGRHDKVELMPYGEYIPGERFLPQLRTWFGGQRIISRGAAIEPIGTIGTRKIGAVLCCEDMHPWIGRSLALQGSHLLISIGNEMAFQSEVPLRQHFRISRLRAIEVRRPLVRCMNRGVSAVVAPSGEVKHALPCLAEGAMLIDVPTADSASTWFMRYGVAPCWIYTFAATILSITIAINRFAKRNRNLTDY